MTRTVAPNERGGRLLRNWALTTPELPDVLLEVRLAAEWASGHTVRPGDLAPDDTDLGTADLLGCAVDESDLLAEVEAVVSLSILCAYIQCVDDAHLAALGSSTPSILIRLVPGLVLRLPRW